MELLSSSELIIVVDQEVTLTRLAYGSWISLPREERNAVEAFLRHLWLQVRSETPDPYPYVAADVGRWLCAMARAEPDLRPYLHDWAKDGSTSAQANLRRFIEDYRPEIFEDKQPGAYWEGTLAPWQQVRDWARLGDGRSG